MAFIKGFSELGVKTNVVFIRPNKQEDKVADEFENVTFSYLWEGKQLKNGKFKYVQQIVWITNALRKLKKGDNLIVFGTIEFLFVFSLFNRKVNLYHEMTEHSDVSRNTESKVLNCLHSIYLNNCRKIKGLFVISKNLKRYFVNIGVPEEKVHVINMTVDSARFEALSKINFKEKYIAYCGAISNSKDGVDVLIKSFKQVSNLIPDLKLYLIGEYSLRKDDEFNRKLINELMLEDKVIFTGEVTANDMPQMLKDAKALVLARPNNLQAQNGFPTKLGEYLLSCNPVVVTSVGDIPLFLEDGVNAYVAEPGNINEIAKKLFLAVSDHDKAQEIGKSGYQVAMQNFNYKTESEKIIRVIYPEYELFK
jgi:glycosyltransferase involved in cell wall biosynthesis